MRIARRALLAASGLLGALLALHAPDEGDVFWHLALGRAVLRASARTVPEPYALGSAGEPTVVPEWLWGVLTYGVHQLGGFVALTWLTVVLGLLGGVICALWVDQLCREVERESGHCLGLVSQLLLSVLAMTMFSARLRLRPEVLALPLLLGVLMLSRRFFAARGARQVRLGAGLLALSLFWSQVHGSSVLIPALFALSAAVLRRPLLAPLGMLLLLALSPFSGAHGFGLLQYIADHSATDAAIHMADMAPGDWANFQPFQSVWSLAMSVLALLSIFALVLSPFRLGDALLALLGLALFLTATRFGSMMSLLAMPLATAGMAALQRGRSEARARELGSRRLFEALGALASFGMVVWLVQEFERAHPLLRVGLPASTYPLRGAHVLGSLPAGTHVHTAISAGSTLGFLADGQLLVSIDSRIPLHFDDTEYGTYRDAAQNGQARERFFRRFGITAAVIKRGSSECEEVKRGMRLVSVDALHASFVAGDGSALPGIDGCSLEHIERGCPDPSGVASSIRTLLAQREDTYGRFLQTISALECDQLPAQDALAALPSASDLPTIRDAVVRWRARALWRAGRQRDALAEVERELTATDPRAITVVSELWGTSLPVAELARLYRRGIRDMDDATPARERGKLAVLCFAQGDLNCAYFQGLRAALQGDAAASNVLAQLAQRHPSAHVRRNIQTWLRFLPKPPPP